VNQPGLLPNGLPESHQWYCAMHGTVERCPLRYLWCTDESPDVASTEVGLGLARQDPLQHYRAFEHEQQ